PHTLSAGLRAKGVPSAVAAHVAHLPPGSTLFASFLGYNPIRALLKPYGVLHTLPRANADALPSKGFFPALVAAPVHHGPTLVFIAAIAMSVAGALVSLLRGRQFVYADEAAQPRPTAVAAAPLVRGGGGVAGQRGTVPVRRQPGDAQP